MRGQGIKLLSFIAKQCREMKTLMPAVEKSSIQMMVMKVLLY